MTSLPSDFENYTLWRRRIYDDMSIDEVLRMIGDDVADNPFERESAPTGGENQPDDHPVEEKEGVSDDDQNSTSSF